MPLNIRGLGTLLSLVLLFVGTTGAQNPTTTDVMMSRVSKAKAFVAIKNYAAAIYELEGIRRETNDNTLSGVTQVMLMNCYLEQLDYRRAQKLLKELFDDQKANKAFSNYFAVAGQVVKSARSQLDRYKSLGLSVTDRNLPPEAVTDIEKMRETVEMVVDHSKTLSDDKKLISDSMALLEEASYARSGLARDEYDAKRWRDQVADAREQLSASRTTIINTVNDGTPSTIDTNKTLATNGTPTFTMTSEEPSGVNKPASNETPKPSTDKNAVSNQNTETKDVLTGKTSIGPNAPATTDPNAGKKPAETTKTVITETTQPVVPKTQSRERLVRNDESARTENSASKKSSATESAKAVNASETEVVKEGSPIEVGSLVEYATARVNPTYPPAAKTMRMTGTVKVEVLVNEDGSIAEVQNTSGPSMLQRAATDALKKWKFKPFIRDGQPVKATGFVSFNFNL